MLERRGKLIGPFTEAPSERVLRHSPGFIVTTYTIEGTWVPAQGRHEVFHRALNAAARARMIAAMDGVHTRVENENRTKVYASFAPRLLPYRAVMARLA